MTTPPDLSFASSLEWRPLKEFEGAYEVSDAGEVRSTGRSKRILIGSAYGAGAVKVTLVQPVTGKPIQRSVARLVAAEFLPPSKLPLLKHKDENKYNNAASNLEWADYVRTNPKTIMKHAIAKGLVAPPNYNHKLMERNLEARLFSETGRIRSAIRSVQPLTLIEVFGDLLFSFPENIVTDEALDAARTLLASRRAVGWEPRAVLRLPTSQAPTPAPVQGPTSPPPADVQANIAAFLQNVEGVDVR